MKEPQYGAQSAYRRDEVARQYDRLRFSGLSGRFGNWLDRRAVASLLAGRLRAGSRVLDMPCGTGRLLDLTRDRYQVVGADISLEMIAQARARPVGEGVPFVQTDATRLSFKANSFDCVMAIRFLGHLPDDVRAATFAELTRISDGYILIEACLNSPVPRLVRWVRRWLTGQRNYLLTKWQWRTFDRSALFAECEALGWTLVARRPKLWPLSDSWYLLYRVLPR